MTEQTKCRNDLEAANKKIQELEETIAQAGLAAMPEPDDANDFELQHHQDDDMGEPTETHKEILADFIAVKRELKEIREREKDSAASIIRLGDENEALKKKNKTLEEQVESEKAYNEQSLKNWKRASWKQQEVGAKENKRVRVLEKALKAAGIPVESI